MACCTLSLQRLLAERDSLREANEELRCAQMQPRGLAQAGELEVHPRAWESAGLEPYLATCAVRANRKGSAQGLSSLGSQSEAMLEGVSSGKR